MPADELAEASGGAPGSGGDGAVLETLTRGEVEVLGRIPWGSNATLLADVHPTGEGQVPLRAVYKPRRGERPLWDFSAGLDRREVAAYELSRVLGWDLVPETVLREDLPFGVGSLQRFVPADPDHHYFTLLEDTAHHDTLRAVCCFDLVTNQADRKGGHCLLGRDERIWAVDNGLAFHRDLKLRTVIWDFAGEAVPGRLRDDLARLAEQGPPSALEPLLDEAEQAALLKRARVVSVLDAFPDDHTGRRYPWPPI